MIYETRYQFFATIAVLMYISYHETINRNMFQNCFMSCGYNG